MIVEIAGFLYGIFKDVVKYAEWDEETKLVNMAWVSKSGFQQRAEADGYRVTWSRPDRIEERKLDGYEIIHEIDEKRRIRRRIVLRDGSILVGKKQA